jgi:hypothetical protein
VARGPLSPTVVHLGVGSAANEKVAASLSAMAPCTSGDEDIMNMDTPSVVAYDSKVKVFFSIIIFNTCDEWTLHHDMCSMSITEVLTWIKEGADHAWKRWIMIHLDWGPDSSAPYAPTRSPHYLWYKETKRLSLIQFGKAGSSLHQNHH